MRAIVHWYEGLDYELAANLRLFVFTLMLAAGGGWLVSASMVACSSDTIG